VILSVSLRRATLCVALANDSYAFQFARCSILFKFEESGNSGCLVGVAGTSTGPVLSSGITNAVDWCNRPESVHRKLLRSFLGTRTVL